MIIISEKGVSLTFKKGVSFAFIARGIFFARKMLAIFLSGLLIFSTLSPAVTVFAMEDVVAETAGGIDTQSPEITATPPDSPAQKTPLDTAELTENFDPTSTPEILDTPDETLTPEVTPDTTTPDTSEPPLVNNKAASLDQAAAFSANASASASSTGLPNRQESYKLQTQVDEKSGALIFDYPIEIPPGRNGFTPGVHLSYNSQNRDTGSIIGHGWSIAGIPEISRVNRTGVDQFYGQNVENWILSSSLSGELTYMGNSTFRSKTEDGSWLMYEYNASYQSFTVTDKSGTKYTFGQDAGSRQTDPNNSANIYRWLITSITDANGNLTTFQYFTSQGQIYPYRINYADGLYALQFNYQYRNDPTTSYKTGFSVRTEQQLYEIQFQTSGEMKKSYRLQYITGQNGQRNLLEKIQLSAYDSQGNWMTYPATSYQYTANGGANWTTSSMTLPPNTNLNNGQSMPVDFNGDGYTDMLTAYQDYNGNIHKYAYINRGDGTWTYDSAYLPPEFFITFWGGSTIPTGFTVIDINGDLLPDLVQSFKLGSNQPLKNVYLNTGAGWSYNSSYSSPTIFIWNNNGHLINLLSIGDFNGDGLADINAPYGYEYAGMYPATYYNNSGRYAGFRASNTVMYLSANSSDNQQRYADINGDGIDDILNENVYFNGNSCYYDNNQSYLMNGKGDTVYSSNYNSPHQFCPYIGYSMTNDRPDRGGRMWDINNDGLQDIVHATNFNNGNNDHATYINTGDGWSYNSAYTIPSHIQLSSPEGTVGNLLDLNGDGIQEIAYYNTVYTNTFATQADLLRVVNYPTGGSTVVSYKPSTHYRDSSNNLLNPKLPFSILTVSTLTNTDPYTNVSSTDSYTYASGAYYYNAAELSDKKFAGFGKVSQKDSVGNTTISYFHTGKGGNADLGAYGDYFGEKIGRMYRQESFGSNGKLYMADIYLWDMYKLSSYGFVFLKSHLHQDFNGQSGHKDRAVSYTYDTSTGNVLSKTDHGRVVGNSDGNFSDYTSTNYLDTATTNYLYASDSLYKKFQVSQETIYDSSGNKLREGRYYYDNLPLGQLSRGNMTRQQNLVGGGEYVTSSKAYNGAGLVTMSTDARGNTISYSYDSYSLFPASVTNTLGHTTTFEYNYAVGKVSSSTDSNGFVRETLYDGIGRVIAENSSERGNLASRVPRVSMQYIDTPGSSSVIKKVFVSQSNSIESHTYLDGFGRPIQTRTESDDYNSYQTQDIFYNSIGQISRISQPYFSTGSYRTSAHGSSSYYTSYTYDPLYRQLTATNTLGTSSTQYYNWQVTQVDANGNKKDYSYDARGYLTEVVEYFNPSIASTFYHHDVFGNLKFIYDAKGNVRNFTYDALGRRITAEDNHSVSDTTYGVYTYSYDNNGNLITKTDPNGAMTSTAYDVLNRPTAAYSTSHDAGSTPTETYHYDTCGTSFLCTITQYSPNNTPVSSHVFTYFKDGLTQSDTHQILQKSYTTNYTYDYAGNPITTTQPNGDVMNNSYDNQSRTKQITFNGSTIVNGVGYDLNNTLNYISFSNSTTQYNQYDPTKMNRLVRKWAINGTGKRLQDLAYSYDSVGNIIQLSDVSQTQTAKTMNYTYDGVYRLLSATATNTANGQNYTHSYTYDVVGNILTNSAIGEYKYTFNTGDYSSYANPHAVSYIRYPSYGVDDIAVPVGALARLGSFSTADTSDFIGQYYSSEDNSIDGYYPGDDLVADVVVPEEITPIPDQIEDTVIPPSNYLDAPFDIIPPTEEPTNNEIVPVESTPEETPVESSNTEIPETQQTNEANSEINSVETQTKGIIETAAPGNVDEANEHILQVNTANIFSHIGRLLSVLSEVVSLPHAYAAAPVVPTPVITPTSGSYTGIQTVTISNVLEGVKIHYTTNGTNPTTASPVYTTPFAILATTTVKALAVKSGYTNSATTSNLITITLPTAPSTTFSVNPGTYTTIQNVSLTTPLTGATIYYTTNGTTPTTASTLYTAPIQMSTSTTIKTLVVKYGYKNSAVISGLYTINLPTAPTPVITPAAGIYSSIQTVTITSTLPGATIHFTTDGTIPTTASPVYSAPITVSKTGSVKALAVKSGYKNSAVASNSYTINLPTVPTPVFSKTAGTYYENQTIAITDTLAGTTIHFTTDGSTPTTASPVYSAPVIIDSTKTVRALGVKYGYNNSAIASAIYTLKAANPVITPAAGSYTTIQTVSIAHTLPGATIYYTTNGTNPTTASPVYTTPFAILATTTVKALAVKSGYTSSDVVSKSYTINLPTAPTPVITPAAGIYSSIQTVTITSTLPGATIHFTTDGTIPTTASPVYSAPITVSKTGSVKALAVKSGYKNSAVASNSYTINLPPTIQTFTTSPNTIIDGSPTTLSWTISGGTPSTLTIDQGVGSVLGTTSKSVTISGVGTKTYTLTAKNSYGTTTKQVTVTVNPKAPIINTLTASPATTIVGDPTTLSWTLGGGGASSLSIDNGVGTVTGTSKVLNPLITTTYTLTATNITGSATKSVSITVNLPSAPASSITPTSGSYTGVQTISMTNTLTGSSIHYTTDGSSPTTASPLYISPFTLSSSATVKAITVKSGYYDSSVTSRVYTIILPTAPAPTTSLPAGSYIGDQTIALSNTLADSTIHYTTDGTTPTAASPLYITPFTLSSSATVRAITVKANYNNSPVTTIAYTITPVAPIPSMSPAGGTSSDSALVTLTTSLAGATIYYTTDGSTPTTTSSVYSGPFTLTSSAIVTAMSTKSGYQNSSTVTGVFTILANKTTFTYDRNGNLLRESGRKNALYTWDSNNRMTSSTLTNSNGSQIISTYLYDTGGQRIHEKVIKKTGNTVTDTRETYYPSKTYSESYDGGNHLTKRVEHVFLGGTIVATVEQIPIYPGNSAYEWYVSQEISYHLTDHLDSTQVTTDTYGNIVELNDYYAFGNTRQNIKTGTFTEQRKYIGEVFDADTGLNYLNARYYNSNYGRFISQDPVFWEVGMTKRGMGVMMDPQQMNSYSYARNNPINGKDPSGLFNMATGAVEKGDTLSKITQLINKQFGTKYTYQQIADLNGIKDPNVISVGQKITPNNKTPDITKKLNTLMIEHVKDPKIVNPFYFHEKVKNGGDWDLKKTVEFSKDTFSEGFVYAGIYLRSDAPGNIHYGFVGKGTIFSENFLFKQAGENQQNGPNANKDWLTTNKKGYGDDPYDTIMIEFGFNLYDAVFYSK